MTLVTTNKRHRMLALGMVAMVMAAACGGGGSSDAADPPSPPPPPTAAPQLSLLAGSVGGAGNVDGPAGVARLVKPTAIVIDAAGNRFVADSGNHTIRKIAPDGMASTLAGKAGEQGSADGPGSAARFDSPRGLALDGSGGLFVADGGNHTIRRIAADGSVSTVAGAAGQQGTANGPGTTARFAFPEGLAFDGSRLFIADTNNHAIRRLDADGTVSTHAGLAGVGGDATPSGSSTAARFLAPRGLALAGDGALFVADQGNCVIRRVASNTVTIAAGVNNQCNGIDGPLSSARLALVSGLAFDGNGALVFSESSGSHRIRSLSFGQFGVVTTLNSAVSTNSGHADGALANALFSTPSGLALEAQTGRVLVADAFNDVIRSIDRTAGQVSTVIGQPPAAGVSIDAVGAAARFLAPRGLAVSRDGSVLVADNQKLRRVQADGTVLSVALVGTFDSKAVAEAPNGTIYMSFFSRLGIVHNGLFVTGVGNSAQIAALDGDASTAVFGSVRGIDTDSQGRLVVADVSAHAVRRVTQGGVVSRVAGNYGAAGSAFGDALDSARFDAPIDVAVAANDDIFVLDAANRTISKISPGANGRDTVSLLAANFDDPRALALDEAGNLYVAEGTLQQIVRIRPSGERSVIAGQAGVTGFAPGVLPGALAMPALAGLVQSADNIVSLKVRNNRLLMTMEKGIVQISPLPQ